MALKIVCQICCDIDAHKTFVVASIASANKQGVTTYKRHRFSTIPSKDYKAFTAQLKKVCGVASLKAVEAEFERFLSKCGCGSESPISEDNRTV